MSDLSTGFFLNTIEEEGRVTETKASKVHLVGLDEQTWCGAKGKGEFIILSYGVKAEYVTCGRCKKEAKRLEGNKV